MILRMRSNLLTGLSITPDWKLPSGVRAVISTRDGGVSDGSYGSMNLSHTVGDDTGAVQENRIRFACGLVGEPRCAWLTQLHTVRVVAAHEVIKSNTPTEADASWTDEAGIACVVLTADCVPILLADDEGRMVAAIHAGWRGLAAGIVQNTIEQFAGRSFSAFVGPAISQQNYAINLEIKQKLIDAGIPSRFFSTSLQEHVLADLPGSVAYLLKEQGAHQVQVHGQCTYALPKLFYSARRDGYDTGRMATAIWIEDPAALELSMRTNYH